MNFSLIYQSDSIYVIIMAVHHRAFKDYLKAYQYIDDNRETTMKVIINVSEK